MSPLRLLAAAAILIPSGIVLMILWYPLGWLLNLGVVALVVGLVWGSARLIARRVTAPSAPSHRR